MKYPHRTGISLLVTVSILAAYWQSDNCQYISLQPIWRLLLQLPLLLILKHNQLALDQVSRPFQWNPKFIILKIIFSLLRKLPPNQGNLVGQRGPMDRQDRCILLHHIQQSLHHASHRGWVLKLMLMLPYRKLQHFLFTNILAKFEC